MIPLHDDNPTALTPFVTVGLIAACVAVFLWQVSLPSEALDAALYGYGMIPAVLSGERELARGRPATRPALAETDRSGGGVAAPGGDRKSSRCGRLSSDTPMSPFRSNNGLRFIGLRRRVHSRKAT